MLNPKIYLTSFDSYNIRKLILSCHQSVIINKKDNQLNINDLNYKEFTTMFMGQEDTRKEASAEEILALANKMIQSDYDYMDGMKADSVIQNGEILVFKGEFFLDEEGLPTAKTNAVFNMFKKVTTTLSKQYKLK